MRTRHTIVPAQRAERATCGHGGDGDHRVEQDHRSGLDHPSGTDRSPGHGQQPGDDQAGAGSCDGADEHRAAAAGTEESARHDDTGQDTGQDTAGQRQDSGSEMVEELRDRIAYLERQVEEEREARRRADTILAQLSAATAEQARTIRAIEAPVSEEDTEGAGTAEEEPEEAAPRPATIGPQTSTQRSQRGTLRSLRRRILGW